jgi:hypothetical protein
LPGTMCRGRGAGCVKIPQLNGRVREATNRVREANDRVSEANDRLCERGDNDEGHPVKLVGHALWWGEHQVK